MLFRNTLAQVYPNPRTFYQTSVLNDNPFAYWTLDETSGTTAADATGNGNDATIRNSPNLSGTALITEGTSIEFDGNDDWIETPITTAASSGAITLEAIIKTPSTIWSNNARIVTKDQAGSQGSWNIRYNSSGSQIEFKVNDGSGYEAGNGKTLVSDPQPDTVYHLVMVYNIDNGDYFGYLDGELTTEGSFGSGGLNDDGSPIVIGADSSGSGSFFDGLIDEVAYYKHGLTQSQIQVHSDGVVR